MKRIAFTVCAALLLANSAAHAQTTLRIGLQDDPDSLDPHRARTYVSRLVFTALCDKLVDTTPDLKIVPRLATSWSTSPDGKVLTLKLRSSVTFHDGEPFDAEAVKFNLDRARTLPDSLRKSELASIEKVDVIDPLTISLTLKQPDATLLAQLTDRAGMMLAPKATASGNPAVQPVCSGPYKFVQRVQNDRIVLERYADHWQKDAYHFDRIIFLPIPDSTVRLANLRAGGLDLIERMAASDVSAARADPGLAVVAASGLGFMAININVANGPHAKTPMGQDARVRQAFSMAIDRDVLNQVVFEKLYTPGDQPFPPTGPFRLAVPTPPHDIEKAKALIKAAGVVPPVKLSYIVSNNTISQQVAQVIQAMTAEAGFEVSLTTMEFATQLKEEQQGNFEASMVGWSGRIDPDGNIHQFVTCSGSINEGKYCNPEVDRLLNEARSIGDEGKRKETYAAAWKILHDDLPIIYLYFEPRLFAMTRRLQNFTAHPDGMVRLDNLRFAQ